MENEVKPIWQRLVHLDWQFGLFLLLVVCIPRFILVLAVNASGNYSSIRAIMVISAEYYSVVVYLLGELKAYCHSTALKEAYRQARGQAIHYQQKYQLDTKYPYIASCRADSTIQHFLARMVQGPTKGIVIVKELKKLFTVYMLYEAKNYFASEEARIRSDIDNLIAKIAALNGTYSRHIMGMRRYRRNQDGSLNDLYALGYQVYSHFVQLTDLNRWVVVDLRPLRQLLVEKRLRVALKEEEELIQQHDLVWLTPVDGDYKSSLNFN